MTFEWKKNSVTLANETSSVLTLSDLSVDEIGEYECIPSTSYGNHNSSIIQLYAKGIIYLYIKLCLYFYYS